MQIKNKLEKFLAIISSMLLAFAIIMGIKIKDDDKKIEKFEKNLKDSNAELKSILEKQKQIMADRQAILDKVNTAKSPDTVKNITTQTIVPGKTVPKTTKTTKTT